MLKQPWVYLAVLLLFWGGALHAQELGQPLPSEIGVTLERPEGFINLRIENNRFILYFLDEKLNLIEPVYPMAIVRYVINNQYNQSVSLPLRRENGAPFLTAARYIKPPYRYRVTILLMSDASTNVPGNAPSSSKQSHPKRYSSYQSSKDLETSDIKETYSNISLNQL